MYFGSILCCVFFTIWAISALAMNIHLVKMIQFNASAQVILFFFVAVVPFLITDRMSFVDIAWPFGVALIGFQIVLFGNGNEIRKYTIGIVYSLIGLRMGIGALIMAKKTGVIFKTEFPRYQYRKMKLKNISIGKVRFHLMTEVFAQGLANASFLALPGFFMAINDDQKLYTWEIVGICICLIAYVMESTADVQKIKFISSNKSGVCNVGLWGYSRHPNYFSEWLVWTGIVIAAFPSWLALQNTETTFIWIVLGLGSVMVSVFLYITLIYLTGAIPSEYYSVRKRPEYRLYQESTNIFFPWFPKKTKKK